MTGLAFDAEHHTYTLDDLLVPSVTRILAPVTNYDAIPPDVRDAALLRGRIVHEAIAAYNARDLDEAIFARSFPLYVPYLDAWRAFCRVRRFVPILTEHRVASRRHLVAGTLDALGLLDGVPVLLDFKTGDPRDAAADLQTAAYVALAVEWADQPDADVRLVTFVADHPAIRRHAIQLRANGTYSVDAYTRPADYRDFLTLVGAHHLVTLRRRRLEAAA